MTVPAGTSVTIPVTFTPLAIESYSCTIGFGGSLPSVTLDGVGREPFYQYTLYTDRDFGDLYIGDTRDMNVVIRNTGYDPIPIVPALLGCGDDFVIVSGGEPATLNRLDAQSVVIRFQPTAADTFACALSFGPDIDQVGLLGTARTTGLYFTVTPEVDFGEQEVGGYTNRTVSIHNTGTVGFTVDPLLVGCGDDFIITSGSQTGTLAPGQYRNISVRFQPATESGYSCTLALGSVLPDVPLMGIGTPPTPHWSVNPSSVYFPATVEGGMNEVTLRVYNTGVINFGLDVQLLNADPEFTLVDGEGLVDLGPSLNHQVRIRFQPNGPGSFSGVLDFGSTVPSVNIAGTSYAPVDSCNVSAPELNFGNTRVSAPIVNTFVVRNYGNQPLPVTPVSDSPHFTVTTAPFTLSPGSSKTVYVTFLAAELGSYEGTINMGNAICSEIVCLGSVIPLIDPGPDALGIFFDQAFSSNETYPAINTAFDAYLVLINPSDPSPIAGWECNLEIEGQIFVLGHYYPEQAIRLGEGSDYVVGYATPLPSAGAVKLLTLSMLAIFPTEVATFSLSPNSNPTIAGQMSWMTDLPQSFVRMNTTTGQPLVATVYAEAPVGLEVPSPLLSRQDGQVHLAWPAPLQPGSSCHVYRRTATSLPERLTNQPLDASAGTLNFTDNPTGFDVGTTLFYSYGVLVDGVEKSRSLEVEYTFEAPRILTSRLLPNVPNPFNPLTRIRFELAKASDVQVSIFDVTGRLVKVLESGNLAAGEYSRTWQGRDEGERPVASGAYYVRLVLDNKVDHQKIMLLK